MRARPARVMAEIRDTYNLGVRDAWQVYRQFRDELKSEGKKPSLAALSRDEKLVNGIVADVTRPIDEDFRDYEDYDYDWEVTVEYEG